MAKDLDRVMSRFVGRAIHGYDMIEEGDRILVALSGGADSVTMLYWLSEWRRRVGFSVDMCAIHVDMGFLGPEKSNRLKEICDSLGLPFEYLVIDGKALLEKAEKGRVCFVCSRYRRMALFRFADRNSYNKIALGHNKDDMVVTFFMNLMFHGEIATLKPVQVMFDKIAIIRPLIFLRKETIRKWLSFKGIEVVEDSCPYKDNTMRKKVEKIVFEHIYPVNSKVRNNVFKAIFNVKPEFLPQKPKGRW